MAGPDHDLDVASFGVFVSLSLFWAQTDLYTIGIPVNPLGI